MFVNPIELYMLEAAKTGDLKRLVDLMSQQTHHKRPGVNARVKKLIVDVIRTEYALKDQQQLSVARMMAMSALPSARQVACMLYGPLVVSDLNLLPEVIALAADDDWEVREWSVAPLLALALHDFPTNINIIEELCHDSNASVRRQVALVVKHLAHKRIENSIHTLLSLTDLLIDSEEQYVRINLGPFCIGDGLLPTYPNETVAALRSWSCRDSWAARWNAAMAFSTVTSRTYKRDGQIILLPLEHDSDRRVSSAARKALRNLAKQ